MASWDCHGSTDRQDAMHLPQMEKLGNWKKTALYSSHAKLTTNGIWKTLTIETPLKWK